MARRIVLLIACVLLLALGLTACGGSTGSTSAAASAGSASSSANQSSSGQAAAPGCGVYCQQAGGSAGNTVVGYPCPSHGCEKCPAGNCVALAGDNATVASHVATVRLSCKLRTECVGAVLFCIPESLCHVTATEAGAGGRLAASDFKVAAGATSSVPVGVTTLGEQILTANRGGFDVEVMVDMLDYGYVLDTLGYPATVTYTVTTNDPHTYPPGAIKACGGTLFVGADTSCPFAQNVEKAYDKTGYAPRETVTASSPVTGQTYQMQCTLGSPVVCRGGTNAVVEFYT